MQSVALVEHHVKDYGYTVAVAQVDECFVVGRCAVCLVGSEVEIRVVSPGIVSAKFGDREQFYSIDTQFF